MVHCASWQPRPQPVLLGALPTWLWMLLDLVSIPLTFSISEGQVIVLGECSKEVLDPAAVPAEFPDPRVVFFSSLAAVWRPCLESRILSTGQIPRQPGMAPAPEPSASKAGLWQLVLKIPLHQHPDD